MLSKRIHRNIKYCKNESPLVPSFFFHPCSYPLLFSVCSAPLPPLSFSTLAQRSSAPLLFCVFSSARLLFLFCSAPWEQWFWSTLQQDLGIWGDSEYWSNSISVLLGFVTAEWKILRSCHRVCRDSSKWDWSNQPLPLPPLYSKSKVMMIPESASMGFPLNTPSTTVDGDRSWYLW